MEYYFYGWNINESGVLKKLLENTRSVQNINNIYNKYFNQTISFDPKLQDKTIIYSFDITEEHLSDNFISNNIIDQYCHTEINDDQFVKPNSELLIYEYNYILDISILKSTSLMYIINETKWEIIHKKLNEHDIVDSNIVNIIKKYYNNSKYFIFCLKHKINKIRFYFHCIAFHYFIDFLKYSGYETDFIEFFMI